MRGNILIAFLAVIFINGCAVASDDKEHAGPERIKKLPTSYVLQGTKTAVVGIAVDKKGFPLETVKAVVVSPGQRVIFAGPDQFHIAFKNKKFPDKTPDYRSDSGVIIVQVPKDILERPEFREEYRKNKSVEFNYAIRINGRELDPPFIVRKEN